MRLDDQRPRTGPELRIATAAAQTGTVSEARIRPDSWKSVRLFKGIICDDISKFESYMPSHAVRSLWLIYGTSKNARHSTRLARLKRARPRAGIRGVPCCGRSSLCRRHILNVVGGVLRVMRRTTFKQNFVLAMGHAHAGKRSSNIGRPLRDSPGSRPRLRSSPVPSRVRGDTFRHSRAA